MRADLEGAGVKAQPLKVKNQQKSWLCMQRAWAKTGNIISLCTELFAQLVPHH